MFILCRPGGKYGGVKPKSKNELEMHQAASNIAVNTTDQGNTKEPTEMKNALASLNSSLWSELL